MKHNEQSITASRELRRRAKDRLAREASGTPENLKHSERGHLPEELRIHQIELELQNEELRHREGELTAARDRYLELWEEAPVAYLLLDRTGRITAANTGAALLFDQSQAMLQQQRLAALLDRRNQVAVQMLCERAWEQNAPDDLQVTISQGDGSFSICQLSCRVTKGVHNRLQAVLVDITDRYLAEEQLRSTQEELEQRVAERTAELLAANEELAKRAKQLSRLSSQLTLVEQRERRRLADMLHENLQQYLVGIKMHLEALGPLLPQEKQPTYQNAYSMILETIDISRSLTAELAPLVLQRYGLAPALQWLADHMRETCGLSVDTRIDADVNVLDDDIALLLFQSVREMLVNVVKHAGTTEALLFMRADDEGGLEIAVSDRGEGFEPGKIMEDDLGFGLFSIHERLELLGGKMTIKSEPGQGTEIRLKAPVIDDEPTEEEHDDIPAPSEEPAVRKPTQQIRILLVDDHVLLRETLSSLLEEENDLNIVGLAADGNEAVELARQLLPDVILMDISMPQMNGVEATRIIHGELPHIRIIGLSMHTEQEQAAAMLDAGAVSCCTKTGDTASLLAVIRG